MAEKAKNEAARNKAMTNELARKYVLGGLSEGERDRIDNLLFEDLSIAARIEEAERDVLDDYAYNRLTGAEMAAVRERMLTAAIHRERLGVALALRERRGRRSFIWPLAVAAAVVACIALYPRLMQVGAPAAKPPVVSPSALPQSREETAVPVVASFLLQPGSLRDGERNLLRIPNNATSIRLELELEHRVTQVWTATLSTSSGETLWKQDNLKPYEVAATHAVAMKIPASQLPRGDKELLLTGGSGVTEHYYFSIIREK